MYINHATNLESKSTYLKPGHDFYLQELEYDLEFLKKIVSIPSPSKNAEAVNAVQECLALELQKLGFEIHWVRPQGREGASLLHAIKKGVSERAISFVGHADTVLAPNSHFNYQYDADKMRITGPGVADDKGGLCVALRGIREYLAHNPTHFYQLHFISSPNEEVGSLGFHHFYHEQGKISDYVLGFEPALFDGSLVSGRNGNAWYRLSVKGKSAHAGRFGEVAINAAHELSRIIYHLHDLNDIANKVKVNVGTITGGSGHFNVVCGEASALIDMRFPDRSTRKILHERFCELTDQAQLACFESGELAQISFEIEDDCPALPTTNQGLALAQLFKDELAHTESTPVESSHTGGAADVNYFVSADNAIVDGLGPIGGGLHTVHEYVELPSIYTRSEALKKVLEKLNAP